MTVSAVSRMWLKVGGALLIIALTVLIALLTLLPSTARSSTPADRIALLQSVPTGLGSFNRGPVAEHDWASRVGVDPAQSHAATTVSGWHVWLASSGAKACLFYVPPGALGPGAACGNIDDAAVGNLAVTLAGEPSHGVTVIGVVPNDVSDVVIQTKDGQTVPTTAQDNVFVAHSDGRPVSYSFTGPDGARSYPVATDQ